MNSPYKIKHWYPADKFPRAYDGWWNVTEWETVEEIEQASGDNLGAFVLHSHFTVKIFYFLFFVLWVQKWGIKFLEFTETGKSNYLTPTLVLRWE